MRKTLSAVAAAALAGVSVFALSTPATAATPVGDTTFYTVDDLGLETGAGYPASDWFLGQLSASYPGGNGTLTSTETGLNISTGAGQGLQLLGQNLPAAPATAAELADLLTNSSGVVSSNDQWTFQLAVFGEPGEPDQQFTTLRPASNGTLSGPWITSRALGAYAAGSSATLSELLDVLYADTAPELLSAGIFVVSDTATSIYAIGLLGEISMFTPVPTRSASTVTPAVATDPGVRFQATGFLPGSEIYIEIYPCDDSGLANTDDAPLGGPGTLAVTAEANGIVDVTVPFDETPEVGTYCTYLDDDAILWSLDVLPPNVQIVVANAVVTPPAALAATGADSTTLTTLGIAGGALLLAGAGLMFVMKRRVADAA